MSGYTEIRRNAFSFFTCSREHYLSLWKDLFSFPVGDSKFNGLSLCSTPILFPRFPQFSLSYFSIFFEN